jgi:hypothetical protein
MAKPEPKKPLPTPLEAAALKAEALAFSSALASRLVEAVPEADRIPLLGDLLAALHPFVPETTEDETAEETVRRLTAEVTRLREQVLTTGTRLAEALMREKGAQEQAESLLVTMSARRSPETALVSRFATMREALASEGLRVEEGREEQVVASVLAERRALREVFANTAKPARLAVLRDDSSDGVRERFTLLLGEVKDGRLSLSPAGAANSSWIDLRPAVETRVVTFLTPVEFGGRR